MKVLRFSLSRSSSISLKSFASIVKGVNAPAICYGEKIICGVPSEEDLKKLCDLYFKSKS